MHTGGRSAADIDAGGVLPEYAGTIVRDGYAGYAHLTDALHAWCGAHGLRDLRAVYELDPDGKQLRVMKFTDYAAENIQRAAQFRTEVFFQNTADRVFLFDATR